MDRRKSGLLIGASLALVVCPTVSSMAQSSGLGSISPGQKVTLKEQLQQGLRPQRPADVAFLNKVVQLVQERKLTLKLVRTTFLWARRKRPYPFQYFRVALVRQAAARGIRISVPN